MDELFKILDLQLFAEGDDDDSEQGSDDSGDDNSKEPSKSGDKNRDKDKAGRKDQEDQNDAGDDSGDDKAGGKKTFDEDYVKQLREEAAKHRKAKKAESERAQKLEMQVKAIQKALGLEDDEPDSVKLQEQLESLKQQLKEEKLRNKFTSAATKLGADPELTYAYLKHVGDLDDLDVEDAKFNDALEEVIESAIDAHPKLKAEKAAPKKTGDDQSSGKDKKGGFSMNDLIRKAAGRT